MTINQISGNYGASSLRKMNLDPKRRVEDRQKSRGTKDTPRGDEVKISDEAHELRSKDVLAANVKKTLATLPETRLSQVKLQQISARIFSGYYSDPDVLEKIADEVIGDGGSLVHNSKDDEIRWDKIEDVKVKIEENFYTKNEVLEVIARELLI